MSIQQMIDANARAEIEQIALQIFIAHISTRPLSVFEYSNEPLSRGKTKIRECFELAKLFKEVSNNG